MLTPSSIVGIRAVIYRTLLSPPYSRNINIISNREFTASNDMVSAKCKLFYKINNENQNAKLKSKKLT